MTFVAEKFGSCHLPYQVNPESFARAGIRGHKRQAGILLRITLLGCQCFWDKALMPWPPHLP